MKGLRQKCGKSLIVAESEMNITRLNDQEDSCYTTLMDSKPTLVDMVFMLGLSVWLKTTYSNPETEIKRIGGNLMDETIGFNYSRGDLSVDIIVYDYGSINFYNEQYPDNCSESLKLDFIEEAERKVVEAIEDQRYVIWG